MYCTREDTAHYDPQHGSWTVQRTHDWTKDRTNTGDVQQLYEIHFWGGHRYIVDAVRFCMGRGLTLFVDAKYFLYESSVNKVTANEGCDTG
ncbi:Uncharacterised protein [Vibrio cholerae]|uniref:Uncharacterized protein n=1 Tax=Vibrio cholerae TaxID=666 RepID=A0A655YE12_VIBCL|nr:Uncharacterised protein [Vibrio cholerae]